MVNLASAACSGAPEGTAGGGGSQNGTGTGTGTGAGGDYDGSFGEGDVPGPGADSGATGASSGGSTAAGQACATETSQAGFQQVYLAFAFDVSASMGSNDVAWRDRSLKWDPISAATKQFFEDPGSTGLRASMTLFPGPARMCNGDTYLTPDVAMTPLPSPAFGEAMDSVVPPIAAWRIGTPTAFVIEGTTAFVEEQRRQSPGEYAIVLVTDGYPELCTGPANSVEAVVERVAAARASGISTFVIGVENPPVEDAPASLENLRDIAAAGNTGEAFIIDTGNAAQTSAAFKEAINEIRGAAVSCTIPIPPPPDGRSFDKQKVDVKYTSAVSSTPTTLVYDQACAAAGTWRYDDPANPTAIVLCDDTCAVVQSEVEVSLGVDFTCEDVIEVPL
ncbi:vWA domain-containing protein [Sorangium sp. So ce887]|uniref:vWA domain-containing protein n=1 Tax=Sorangium sp. So ce887 TaxID=3133324 RepID=UPI003F648D51